MGFSFLLEEARAVRSFAPSDCLLQNARKTLCTYHRTAISFFLSLCLSFLFFSFLSLSFSPEREEEIQPFSSVLRVDVSGRNLLKSWIRRELKGFAPSCRSDPKPPCWSPGGGGGKSFPRYERRTRRKREIHRHAAPRKKERKRRIGFFSFRISVCLW